MLHQTLSYGPLLNKKGQLIASGFSYNLEKQYNRENIVASKLRIKEWDYYLIQNDCFALALTISDLSYIGVDSISFIDFENKTSYTKSPMSFFPMGKKNLPLSSKDGLSYTNGKNYEMSFNILNGERHLYGHMYDFLGENKALLFDIVLSPYKGESIVMATPFKQKKCFYYNQKINCMRAEGRFILDGKEYIFSPADSFAVLDWGRGVWPYKKTTWYWGSLSTSYEGLNLGLNLGYGFGENEASENVIFFNDKAQKLGRVEFIPTDKNDILAPYKIKDDSGFLNLIFKPLLERRANSNFGLIKSLQSQLFGNFEGNIRLINGSELYIESRKGFIEKVTNKW